MVLRTSFSAGLPLSVGNSHSAILFYYNIQQKTTLLVYKNLNIPARSFQLLTNIMFLPLFSGI